MSGKDKKRIRIGFLIHHLNNDYSKNLLKGAAEAARELDADLVIFPGRSLNSQLDNQKDAAYEYQNNVIYEYVSAESLDAAVISSGTLGSFVTKEEFKAFIDRYEGLPVITTESKVRGYPCIRLSGSGIKEIVSHLVKVHGCKCIAFVSGPKGNSDADERLGCYIEALKENGLDYDPSLVAYGKFSEYCTDLVGELLDKNEGRIDAVCFANDMMCKGGYKAIEQRGLRVGEDIAVTGYDDSDVAVSLKPMLTTVRADASRLGSCAVREAHRLAVTGMEGEDINLGSSPVYRFSCGCRTNSYSASDGALTQDSASIADSILSGFIPQYTDVKSSVPEIDTLRELMVRILNIAGGKESGEEIYAKPIINAIITNEFKQIVPPEAFVRILKRLRAAAGCRKAGAEKASAVITDCLEGLCERIVSDTYRRMDEMSFTHFLISNIAKDMTLYGSDEEKCYFSIVNNLYRMNIESSYIYVYESPVIHTQKTEWRQPQILCLKAYHNGDELAAVTGEAGKICSRDIFDNEFTVCDRRRTMVVSPLFMNEEQYGVIVCELENEYFPYIYSITPQICTAIKLTNLVSRLESSLDAAQLKNTMLNRMSMSDELTGIYNRRGFYVFANRILKAPENEGRKAVLIFCDLDNLKIINDTFGHDEGDSAIVSASGFIKNSLRSSDVVARIGGDEFAAFALSQDKEIAAKLPARIKSLSRLYNEKSDKPYNVTVSVGVFELACSPELNIQQFMDRADAALYIDKKNKSRTVLKEEQSL